ncbi:MAG: DUF3899 domain-containing protein [Erysipelotrichaceae bacterium]|nr:DUF3899 domain-containing protein [Erysipelotrichaceae bacterium]MBO4538540.1 DUF3899 domain-containing protein [Erysipelotrichaceae bacterium]MBR5048485.1 DUF3899 domain-containing protein [Erysipelotrichaceae bacterium]
MKLKNVNFTSIIIVSMFVLCYPFLKALTSQSNRLLVFLDALTINSLLMVLFGMIYHLHLKGDFDATAYFIHNSSSKQHISYDDFCAQRQEKRKGSFNYPLFLGLFYLVVSYLAARLLY